MVTLLILIPSTGLWKAELTDRMTEQTQNSWTETHSSSSSSPLVFSRHTSDNLIIPPGEDTMYVNLSRNRRHTSVIAVIAHSLGPNSLV